MHGLPPAELERTLETGILTGLAAGVAMGLFMMLASASWGHAGVFTPFYRIAAVLDRAAYDISLEQAATGSRFWLEPQTALPGAYVHLALAGLFGVLFVLLAHEGRGARPLALVLAGVAWGLVVVMFGLNQARILPGALHWIIQIVHLLLGLGAIGLAENLARRTKAAPQRTRAALGAAS